MKKIKYLLLALTLVFTFGIANVNAETGKTPGTITTKEDLLYYIYYYGGKATITGNTIKLTENLELNQGLTFNNSENITLDLNGNGIYLKNDKIMILASSKSIKITDSSNSTNKGYIRSQSSYAIYNNGISGKLSLENIKLITNSTDPTLYTYSSSTTNVTNCAIQGEKKAVLAGAGSTINLNKSTIAIENTNGEYAITNQNGTVNITNSEVKVIDNSTNGIAIYNNADRSTTTITNTIAEAKQTAIYNEKGTLVVNSGTFNSTSNHALRTSGHTTINSGTFTSKTMAGLQIISGTSNLNEGVFKTNSSTTGGIVLPLGGELASYLNKTSIINNSETTSSSGITYTKEKNAVIVSTPKTKSLSTKTYTYNGKIKTPEVSITNNLGKKLTKNTDYKLTYQQGRKNVGTYYVEISYIGNYQILNKEKLYFTINPKSTYIRSLTKGKKRITVNIKKYTTQTSGYQIMYSQYKNFKNSKTVKINNKTTKKTIKNLKSKKKYYAKVRTYKVVNGKTYYSSWSKIKSIKVN